MTLESFDGCYLLQSLLVSYLKNWFSVILGLWRVNFQRETMTVITLIDFLWCLSGVVCSVCV